MLRPLSIRNTLCSLNILLLVTLFNSTPLTISKTHPLVEAKHHAYSPRNNFQNHIKSSLLTTYEDADEDIDDEFSDFIKQFDGSKPYTLLNEELKNGNNYTTALENIMTSILESSITWKLASFFFQIITVFFLFHLLFTNPLGNETFAAVTCKANDDVALIISCIFSSFFINLISYEIVFIIQNISFAIAWIISLSCDIKHNRLLTVFLFCSLMSAVLYAIISPAPIFPSSTGPVGLLLSTIGLDPNKHLILLKLGYLGILYILSSTIYLKLPSVLVSGPSETGEVEESKKQTIFLIGVVCCWTLASAIGKSLTIFFPGVNPISPDNIFLTPSLMGFNVTTIVSLSLWALTSFILWEGYGVWYCKKDNIVERSIPSGFITEKWRVYSGSS